MVIVGIDEVGRGCLAGPLVCGAVILKRPLKGLKDSKLLTKTSRELLNKIIRNSEAEIGIGWVSADQLDLIGLTRATAVAMERALNQLATPYDEIIIDGNYNYLSNNPKARAVIKADETVPAVSAASIVAKVARDNYMAFLAQDYPGYGFEKHVGYGTRLHKEMIERNGVTQIHRHSFRPVSSWVGRMKAAS
ncbi:MAG TPA: ribonuclease HII [Candidatus Saccharimonadales bacterium]|nr:ribonuclease HII [Candidatus Saccharimonadales bacterium]